VNAYSQRKDQLDKAVEIVDLIEKEYPKMMKKRVLYSYHDSFPRMVSRKSIPISNKDQQTIQITF